MTRGLLVALAVLSMMLSCSHKDGNSSGRILDTEKMTAVMWDIIGADVFTEQFIKKDSLKSAALENIQMQNKIFAIHNVSRADYYKSYDYYLSHTDVMKTMLDSMTARGERNRESIIRLNYDHNIKKDSSVHRYAR
ncbi:MAG: DUF4296 domain-containing protein [Ferruginibacter sp.]